MWPWRSNKGNGGDSEPAASPIEKAEASPTPPLPPPLTTTSPPPLQTPSERLAAAWRAATARVSPGDPIPPRPPQLGEWAANTVLCAGAGAAFCGWREAAAVAGAATVTTTTATATASNKAAVAQAIAEEKTRRLVRIGSEAIR